MRISIYLFTATLGLALFALPTSAQVDVTYSCNATPTGSVEWPAGSPLWTFDFVRPSNSSGSDGSGLELRDVYYNGALVFKRAHTPILNVEYDPGGCGCFRDWSFSEVAMVADGVQTGGCIALATPGTVETTCDTGVGGTPGSFTGVAFEEYPGELVLTTHMSAGWYRYRMKWHFYDDGRIWPEYSFAADSATCTSQTHRHHVYWRFDFDIDGAGNDAATEYNPFQSTSTPITIEDDRTWGNGTDGIYWSVNDTQTGNGYQIIPSAADLLLPIDPFSKADAYILRYSASEIDDGSSGCAINFDSEMNGQSVDGQDLVFWYRSSASHTGGNPFECDIVGPTLIPDNASALDLSCTPVDPPIGIPAGGGNYRFVVDVTNTGTAVEAFDLWFDIAAPSGGGPTKGPFTISLNPGQSFVRTIRQKVPAGAPAGAYTHTCNVGNFATSAVVATDGFGFTKTFGLDSGTWETDWSTHSEIEAELDIESSSTAELVDGFVLERAYPNPFNPSTTVRFKVSAAQNVVLTLYDALGRQVADLFDGYLEANRFETVRVDGSELPSGTYTVRMEGETVQGTTRVVLIK